MWQPMTGPRGTSTTNRNCQVSNVGWSTCLPRFLPPYLPSQLLTSSVPRVTLTVVTRVTHRLVQLSVVHVPHHLPCVASRSCHIICMVVWPVQSACHVALYGLYSHPLFLHVWVFRQNAISFAYGTRLTK
jgi:hypothetical protein